VTQRADALKSLPLFAGLNGRDREFLASNLDEMNFAAGATLIRQGDTNHTFFVLTDGEADVTVSGERRRTMRRGDFLGEISMDQRIPATATVIARTPVQAYVMSHAQFRALTGSPPLLARLQAAMSDRLASDRMLSPDSPKSAGA
jgi:CRP-like cAMP-binding protein